MPGARSRRIADDLAHGRVIGKELGDQQSAAT
jgi:hypothetical protein